MGSAHGSVRLCWCFFFFFFFFCCCPCCCPCSSGSGARTRCATPRVNNNNNNNYFISVYRWEQKATRQGRKFYVDKINRKTQWDRPAPIVTTSSSSSSTAVTYTSSSSASASALAAAMREPESPTAMLLALSLQLGVRSLNDTTGGRPGDDVAIGIDFGTSHVTAAVWQDHKVRMVPCAGTLDGGCMLPNIVAANGSIGHGARGEYLKTPADTAFSYKRLLGQSYDDAAMQAHIRWLPFPVSAGPVDGRVWIHGQDTAALAGLVIKQIKANAALLLKRPVSKAVIAVPSLFTQTQRQAIVQAASDVAGIEVIKLVSEPVAAAVAAGRPVLGTDHLVLVVDVGAGGIQLCLLSVDNNATVLEVRGVAGDPNVGGDDFTSKLVTFCLDQIAKQQQRSSNKQQLDQVVLARLRVACEAAKCTLSTKQEAKIAVRLAGDDADDDNNEAADEFTTTVTRSEFEDLNVGLFGKITEQLGLLFGANVAAVDVAEIVLAGGSTRIPKIQHILKDYFGWGHSRQFKTAYEAQHWVAQGAAIQVRLKQTLRIE